MFSSVSEKVGDEFKLSHREEGRISAFLRLGPPPVLDIFKDVDLRTDHCLHT